MAVKKGIRLVDRDVIEAADAWLAEKQCPAGAAEYYAGVKTIDGILANPDKVGRRFHNYPVGWGCRIVNDNLKVVHQLDKAEIQKKTGHVIGLNNINIDIEPGLITVIMGLSGSGKSTLIRHLNRLIEPTAGEIRLDGDNIMAYDAARLRELRQTQMSMVFPPHDPHCLLGALSGAAADARRWIDRVGLTGNENAYPHQLSGGMQQRVGLARALTSNAEIMLMDEAFSALDPLIRTSMQDLLLELQKDLHKRLSLSPTILMKR